ncbi:substrate-binding periplasmic protein [Marinobacter caseinilyticus]|uniref:substrate-binding periplasmic protein n=1 Tax=Marinobacter caseinilyticus TaxID=2692195 RepID=UPI00140E4938|nr:transporter substrate-binding domain-containing protein [Marinobacter caseinilyticus]
MERWNLPRLLVVTLLLIITAGPAFGDKATEVDKVNNEADKPVLRTGFVEFPPFKYADDNGNASGPWVEMTERVAAEAGYRIEWVHLPIARVYLYLARGDIDLWPGVSGIPELAGQVVESESTPMRIRLYAYHKPGMAPIASPAGLAGKRLILINGFSYLGALNGLDLEAETIALAPTHEAALSMLQLDRGDYLIDYDEPVEAVKPHFPDVMLKRCQIHEVRGAFVAPRQVPESVARIKAFDRAYARLLQQGQLQALQDRSSGPAEPASPTPSLFGACSR